MPSRRALLKLQLGRFHQPLPAGNLVDLVVPQFRRTRQQERIVQASEMLFDFRRGASLLEQALNLVSDRLRRFRRPPPPPS